MITLFLKARMFINLFAYTGLVFSVDQELLESKVISALSIHPTLANIIVVIAIFLWSVKAVWFIYSKFFLERKERILSIKKATKELNNNENS